MPSLINKNSNKILILGDNRVGTYSQAVALAREAGYDYEILFLEYNFFKFIPNIFFSKSLIRLKKSSREKIKAINYLPQYIISAGRRPASCALFLKNYFLKKFQFKSKIIQIMRPEMGFYNFDFVIIPQHDEPKKPYPKNLIISVGALTKVFVDKDNLSYKKFYQELQNFKKPLLTLLIGGDSKGKEFSIEMAQKLIENCLIIQKKINATLLIMNSRRTSTKINDKIKNLIKNNANNNIIFYDYNLLTLENPYHAILSNSDYFVISGDSVSMISECCGTGKPVYIFYEDDFCSQKHRRFHDILVKNNYAKFLDSKKFAINDFKPRKLDEARRVAGIIF